jgi:hypothetical protein
MHLTHHGKDVVSFDFFQPHIQVIPHNDGVENIRKDERPDVVAVGVAWGWGEWGCFWNGCFLNGCFWNGCFKNGCCLVDFFGETGFNCNFGILMYGIGILSKFPYPTV